jgi:hypothetical protein
MSFVHGSNVAFLRKRFKAIVDRKQDSHEVFERISLNAVAKYLTYPFCSIDAPERRQADYGEKHRSGSSSPTEPQRRISRHSSTPASAKPSGWPTCGSLPSFPAVISAKRELRASYLVRS